MRLLSALAPIMLAASLSACSLSGLLGGGAKAPPSLLTLTTEAPSTGEFARAASAGEAVTIHAPVIPKELRTPRVPVQVTPTDVQYVTDGQWVDTPDRLFRDLLAETVRRVTSRVVLSGHQTALDPGLIVSGQLHQFGYDAQTGMAVV